MRLKPCPFCGGKAEQYRDEPDSPYQTTYSIDCATCDPHSETEEGAQIYWNTRAKDQCAQCQHHDKKTGFCFNPKNPFIHDELPETFGCINWEKRDASD